MDGKPVVSLNTKELDTYIRVIQERTGKPHPFFVVCASIMKRSVTTNFREGGRPIKWKPLSGWTMAGRAGMVKTKSAKALRTGNPLGQPILNATGKLLQSLGSVHTETASSLEWGTALIYANLMQEGGTIRPKNVKFLTLPFAGVTGKARDYSHTFVAKGIIFQKEGTEIRPLFLLKSKVDVPSRTYMKFQDADITAIMNYGAAFAFGEKTPTGGVK